MDQNDQNEQNGPKCSEWAGAARIGPAGPKGSPAVGQGGGGGGHGYPSGAQGSPKRSSRITKRGPRFTGRGPCDHEGVRGGARLASAVQDPRSKGPGSGLSSKFQVTKDPTAFRAAASEPPSRRRVAPGHPPGHPPRDPPPHSYHRQVGYLVFYIYCPVFIVIVLRSNL